MIVASIKSDVQSESALSDSVYSDSNMDMDETSLSNSTAYGTLKLSLEYKPSFSILEVTIHEARNLLGVDKDGLSDPYATLTLSYPTGHKLGETKRTKFLKNTLNPIFEENFEFTIHTSQLPLANLNIYLKNHVGRFTLNGRTRHIGYVKVDLNEVLSLNSETKWYDIKAPRSK